MKKNLVKLVALAAAFTLSVGVAVSVKSSPTGVEATQYAGNFSYYKYTGSYYSSLDTSGSDGLNGNFRKALTTLIYPKGWYIYGGGGSDHLSGVLQDADEDPTNSNNMVYLYTRDSVKKTAATVNNEMQWNREHVWPQSLSINNSGTQCWGTEEGGTDILHLRPTEETTNSARGNKLYADVNKANPQRYNGMLYGYISGNYFEPLDEVKGDVARILMYVWTAYTDHYSGLNVTKTISNYDTLLKWHTMDQPDAMEGHRNDYCVTSKQKNRNPFVDHPEYAWRIFGDSCSSSVKEACKNAYPADGNWTPSGSSSSNPPSSSSNNQNTSTNVVAGEYSITFKTNSEDGSNALSTSDVLSSQVSSNNLIKSVDAATKVYQGKSGIKLGSSSSTGEIKFSLLDGAKSNIVNVKIESAKYGSDTGNLVLKIDDATISSDINPGITFNKQLNKISVSSITISTTAKRAYLSKLTITIADDSSGSSSSEPPISSSEPPVSSDQNTSSSQESSVQQPNTSSETNSTSENSSIANSEQQTTTSENTQSSQNESKNKKTNLFGCNGSIIATASLVSVAALVGIVFIFSKKKN